MRPEVLVLFCNFSGYNFSADLGELVNQGYEMLDLMAASTGSNQYSSLHTQ